jgi:hypothetical protein
MCLNAEPWHVIDKSLYGLPGIAFGGYVGGLLAAELDCDTKVDFHAPTPLKTQLEIRRGHGRVDVFAADVLVATARPHRSDLEPPRLPDWDEACRAVDEYLQKAPITHPDCFGCGPDRRSDSGLRIFTGVDGTWGSGRGRVAAAGRLRRSARGTPSARVRLVCPGLPGCLGASSHRAK